MKKVKAILAIFSAMFVCAFSISAFVSAEPTVTGTVTYDFSTCTPNEARASITKENLLNVYDFGNLIIGSNEMTGTVISPGGYAGEGYVTVKLAAPTGKKLDTVLFDMDYWVYNASGGAGYVDVYVSQNGTDFTKLTRANATADKNTAQHMTMGLTAAKGQDAIYVKVAMQHWESWNGAALKKISLENVISDVYTANDFSALTSNGNKTEVTKDYLGVYESSNLQVGGNNGNVVTPGGYAGEGYIVSKLEAATGETFDSVLLNLDYWAYHADSNSGAGYVKVQVSANGQDYTDVATMTAASTLNAVQNLTDYLTVTEGQTAIYVKVIMQHWESYEGAALKGISLTGMYADNSESSSSSSSTDSSTSSVISSEASSEISSQTSSITSSDTSSKTKVTVTKSFTALAFGEVSAQSIGAVDSSNLKFGVDGVGLLSARNGYEEAYAVWKMDAASGETFSDATFSMVGRTWYQDAGQKNNNSLKVYVSTDGTNYTLVKEYKSNDNADINQTFTNDLTTYAKGASTVYVKVSFLVFDSPHIMGLKSISFVGNANGGTGNTTSNSSNTSSVPTGEAIPAFAFVTCCVAAMTVVAVKKRH